MNTELTEKEERRWHISLNLEMIDDEKYQNYFKFGERPAKGSRELKVEEVQMNCDIRCNHIEKCEMFAIKMNWLSFSCVHCPYAWRKKRRS